MTELATKLAIVGATPQHDDAHPAVARLIGRVSEIAPEALLAKHAEPSPYAPPEWAEHRVGVYISPRGETFAAYLESGEFTVDTESAAGRQPIAPNGEDSWSAGQEAAGLAHRSLIQLGLTEEQAHEAQRICSARAGRWTT